MSRSLATWATISQEPLVPLHKQEGTQPDQRSNLNHRSDIQGLRAVAVGLVLLYHAGIPLLGGGYVGVDVFFVISGFLITGLMLKEVKNTGSLSLVRFYSNRIRRILPAATTVLVVTSLAALVILPRTRWESLGGEILGSATYIVNWILAAGAVNYLTADVPPSAVQHFWTLSVEEQFYLVWPLLIVTALALSRLASPRRRSGLRRKVNLQTAFPMVTAAIATLTVLSLVWSAYLTSANPGRAYFVTTTRAWELGLGSVVALAVPQLSRLPRATAIILGWLGLVGIIAASILYQAATPFPGTAALLPTVGAALVIVAGIPGHGGGAATLLSLRPMTWVGDLSYSLYLWHWPLVVFGTYLLGGTMGLAPGLALVLMSVVPAILSRRYVELPFMRSRNLRRSPSTALGFGVIMMLVSALVASSLLLIPEPRSAAVAPATESKRVSQTRAVILIGAELLAKDAKTGVATDSVVAYEPSAVEAAKDNPSVYANGCMRTAIQDDGTPCTFGKVGAAFTVAIVGDSHAAQWIPALTALSEKHAWELNSYTKGSCPFTANPILAPGGMKEFTSCTVWNTKVLEQLISTQPDLVLVTSSDYQPAGSGEFADGLAKAWETLEEAHIPIAVVLDTPRPRINIPECISENPNHLTKCAVDRNDALINAATDQRKAAGLLKNVSVIDMNSAICPEKMCAAIIGNVIVYRDSNHLTATYAKSLASTLGAKMMKLGAPA